MTTTSQQQDAQQQGVDNWTGMTSGRNQFKVAIDKGKKGFNNQVVHL
jgi:hypothetical protein